MNASVAVFAVILSCLCSAYALPKVGMPYFQLRVGNCGQAPLKDRVFFDHVEMGSIPLYVRNHNSEWRGDKTIYCVLAESFKAQSEGSTAEITDGGLHHHYVTIALKSGKGHGLEYNVSVYANKTAKAS